jgi:hypothetical protein
MSALESENFKCFARIQESFDDLLDIAVVIVPFDILFNLLRVI